MQYKKMVVFANSRKHAGRCLAGREILGENYAGWIRPVSERIGEEVSEHERQYNDGSDPQVLDVVDVPIIMAKPHARQTENWLISPDYFWNKVGALNWNQARALAENPLTLWINGDSTFNGLNDQIAQELTIGFTSSICLIYVDSVAIHVLTPGASFGNYKRRVQARFKFNGISYWIWVTDPMIEQRYSSSNVVVNTLGECLIAVSLAEPHRQNSGRFYHYKLAAAIIHPA